MAEEPLRRRRKFTQTVTSNFGRTFTRDRPSVQVSQPF
jgi:hypothetical protein